MRYHFTKIGPGNSLAGSLLAEKRLGSPALAGFFRAVRLPEIEDHPPDQRPRFSYQALDMYRWARGEIPGYAVNLAQGVFRVLEPVGAMYEMERELFEKTVGPTPHKDDVPKLVPVHIVYEERITHIPTILSQINANRRLSSSTFKEITDDFGLELAVDHLLFKGGLLEDYPRSTVSTRTAAHLLRCLGNNELIVLVARILEERGLYVPAPTGGFVKNIDLFAYNDRPAAIDLEGMLIPGRSVFRPGAITVQVRGISADQNPEPGAEIDYLVQLNANRLNANSETARAADPNSAMNSTPNSVSDTVPEPAPDESPERNRVLNDRWIVAMLRCSPETRRWLNRVLRWVPFAAFILADLSGRADPSGSENPSGLENSSGPGD